MKRRGPGIVLDGAVTPKVEPGECRTPNPIHRQNSAVGMVLGDTSRTWRGGQGKGSGSRPQGRLDSLPAQ